MTTKQLTLIAYGGDRELWAGGALQLRVRDLFAGVDREVRRLNGSVVSIAFELPLDAGQLYGLELDSPGYRAGWQLLARRDFVRVEGTTRVEGNSRVLRFMLLPDDARSVDITGGFGRLRQSGSPFAGTDCGLSDADFMTFEPAQQMAFLNIEAKLRETWLGSVPVLSLVKRIRDVQVDRVHLFLRAAAKGLVEHSPDFKDAAGHPGHPDSFKHTAFEEGNVQLSFSKQTEMVAGVSGPSEACYSVDADIDLARGLAHAAEWLRNNVFQPKHKTDQVDVYGLLYAQGILPVYTLVRNHA